MLARKAATLLRSRPRGRSFDAMERAVPLGPEDRAILDLEGPTIAGHTCKVVVVEAARPGCVGGFGRRCLAGRLEQRHPEAPVRELGCAAGRGIAEAYRMRAGAHREDDRARAEGIRGSGGDTLLEVTRLNGQ